MTLQPSKDGKKRCFGGGEGQQLYAKYHDEEWGVPVRDDRKLFEMLTLEGAQAGLNWETILKRRQGYRDCFHQFDIEKVANMDDQTLQALRQDASIIRNRLKIQSVRKNAQVVLQIQKEYGSFSNYLWGFVDHQPIVNHWQSFDEVPTDTEISLLLSKSMKKLGMSFVGSVIVYALMQAVGMVNDHLQDCLCNKQDPT